MLTSSIACCIVRPCPISIPAFLLRLWRLSQVTMRSPMPVRPPRVSCRAPMAQASRLISEMPRVISAALVLSPHPRPSAIPAASAITFFKAPPSSIPRTSGLVYTRKTSFMKRFCTPSATARLDAPATTVVGRPMPTSSAWLGPHITATAALGTSCSTMEEIVISVSSSIPFATQTIVWHSPTRGERLLATLLVCTEGTARIMYSLPATASPRSVVYSMDSGSGTPGSLSTCSWRSFSIAISSSITDQTTTWFPFSQSSFARAIPQLPAPRTATFLMIKHLPASLPVLFFPAH